MMFLTIDELEQLSGYKQKSKQAQWLAANGIPFVPNRWNQPIADKTVAFKILGIEITHSTASKKINEKALLKLMSKK